MIQEKEFRKSDVTAIVSAIDFALGTLPNLFDWRVLQSKKSKRKMGISAYSRFINFWMGCIGLAVLDRKFVVWRLSYLSGILIVDYYVLLIYTSYKLISDPLIAVQITCVHLVHLFRWKYKIVSLFCFFFLGKYYFTHSFPISVWWFILYLWCHQRENNFRICCFLLASIFTSKIKRRKCVIKLVISVPVCHAFNGSIDQSTGLLYLSPHLDFSLFGCTRTLSWINIRCLFRYCCHS